MPLLAVTLLASRFVLVDVTEREHRVSAPAALDEPSVVIRLAARSERDAFDVSADEGDVLNVSAELNTGTAFNFLRVF